MSLSMASWHHRHRSASGYPVLSALLRSAGSVFPGLSSRRPARRSAALLSLLALTCHGAYSALNWRTCAELGYCEDVIATVYADDEDEHRTGIFCGCILTLATGLWTIDAIALAEEPVSHTERRTSCCASSSGRGSTSAEYAHAPWPLRRSGAAADSSGSL